MSNITKPEQLDRDAIEALADAWASVDGKVDDFRAGKNCTSMEEEFEKFGGRYSGYMEDAEELMNRLLKRGFAVVPIGRT